MANLLLVRRIKQSDVHKIAKLQQQNAALVDRFPQHAQWLRRAIAEVKSGKGRIAYGVYFPNRIDTEFNYELVGSVIIQRPRFSKIQEIELKNLVISDAFLSTDSREQFDPDHRVLAKRMLIARIERYSQLRGFGRLTVELPSPDNEELRDELNFLISAGFSISGTRHSRFELGDTYFLLSKDLQNLFCGDPFDVPVIAKWLAIHFFGPLKPKLSSLEAGPPALANMEHLWQRLTFVIPPRTALGGAKTLKYVASWIIDVEKANTETLGDVIEENRALANDCNLVISMSSDMARISSLKKIAKEKGIRFLPPAEVKQVLGERCPTSRIDFPIDKVRGVLLELSPDCAARLACSGNNEKYCPIPSGVGRAFVQDDIDFGKDPFTAFFYSSDVTTDGIGAGIWGMASIVNFTKFTPKEAAYKSKQKQFVMSDRDYRFHFKSFSTDYRRLFNDAVVVIVLQNFTIFSKGISPKDSMPDSCLKIFRDPDTDDYDFFTYYLDETTAKELRLAADKISHWVPKPKTIAISYRTNDTAPIVDMICGNLREEFPEMSIKYDLDNRTFPVGKSIDESIINFIESSDIVICMIGPGWRRTINEKDLFADSDSNSKDFVRQEVALALKLSEEKGIRVIPVLLRGVDRSVLDGLPEDMVALSKMKSVVLNFTRPLDLSDLIDAIRDTGSAWDT